MRTNVGVKRGDNVSVTIFNKTFDATINGFGEHKGKVVASLDNGHFCYLRQINHLNN